MEGPTGHAIIQVTPDGENAIVLNGGANRQVTTDDARCAMSSTAPGDVVLIQNEISAVADIMRYAGKRGLTVVFNPAPMDACVSNYPLELVDLFMLNRIEAEALTEEADTQRIGGVLAGRFPRATTVLTLGDDGAVFMGEGQSIHVGARRVAAMDTTAAGDTFIGYFLARWVSDRDVAAALRSACEAAAVCVTRAGAAVSIPRLSELRSES